MAKKDSVRANIYLWKDVRENIERYAKDHQMSMNSSINMILQNYFKGEETLKKFTGLSEFVEVLKSNADKLGLSIAEGGKSS